MRWGIEINIIVVRLLAICVYINLLWMAMAQNKDTQMVDLATKA